MADVIPLTAARTAPVAGEPPPEAADKGAELEKRIAESVTSVASKINSDLRADLGRELKVIKELIGAGAKKDPAVSPTETPTEKTLRDRLAALEEREGRQRQNAIRLSIRDSLVKGGADPELAEMAVPSILEGEGEGFITKESKFGGYEVAYGEATVSDWAKNFMTSDRGKRLAASMPAPSLGLPGSTPSAAARKTRQVPKSQLKALTMDELNSGNIEIVDG